MNRDEIIQRLLSLRDEKYREFNAKLIPTVEKSKLLGVRMPDIRSLAAQIYKSRSYSEFISAVPHEYHEENLLHASIVERIPDFDECMTEIERFLPYVDNWAVCDMFRPKCFVKNKSLILPKIYSWLDSESAYTVRFGIVMLMTHFLDADFKEEQAKRIAEIKSEHFYVKMAVAWYFATALAKQYKSVRPYFNRGVLDEEIRKMAVRKVRDSFRISQNIKDEILR